MSRAGLAPLERGDNKAGIGLATRHLGLADDPAFAAPTVQRGVAKVLEAAGGPACADAFDRRRDQLGNDRLLQPVVAGQAEHVIHPVGSAPRHQGLAGEAEIAAQQNACSWPAAADLCHDPRDFLDRPGGAVDVRAAQLGRQQVPPAEDVERQVAVAVIITMEELALLVAMQRIVGGIEVEDDLFRSLRVSFQEEIDEQAFDRRRVVTNLVITRRFGAAQFQPVQRGLAGQRRTVTRCASSLPASTASTGSRRSWSWSFRSS